MPNRFAITFLGLLASGLLGAADTPPPVADEVQEAPQVAPPRETQPMPRPAPTFTPREKISADSTVAFPVDI